jgi:hypothetical protein
MREKLLFCPVHLSGSVEKTRAGTRNNSSQVEGLRVSRHKLFLDNPSFRVLLNEISETHRAGARSRRDIVGEDVDNRRKEKR